MSDLDLRDTPALAVLRRQGEALDHIDPAHIAAAQDLLRVSKRLLGAFAEEFALRGLSPGRYAVLMALYAGEGALAPSQIAERIGVTRATVTELIRGLVRDDLAAYGPADERDRRRKAVTLTAKARDLLADFIPEIFTQMAELVAPLSHAETGLLLQLLSKVEAGLGRTAASAEKEEHDDD